MNTTKTREQKPQQQQNDDDDHEASTRSEVATQTPRIATTYDGGILILDGNTLELVADLACPWCYLGLRRLRRGTSRYKDEQQLIEAQLRAWIADPEVEEDRSRQEQNPGLRAAPQRMARKEQEHGRTERDAGEMWQPGVAQFEPTVRAHPRTSSTRWAIRRRFQE